MVGGAGDGQSRGLDHQGLLSEVSGLHSRKISFTIILIQSKYKNFFLFKFLELMFEVTEMLDIGEKEGIFVFSVATLTTLSHFPLKTEMSVWRRV